MFLKIVCKIKRYDKVENITYDLNMDKVFFIARHNDTVEIFLGGNVMKFYELKYNEDIEVEKFYLTKESYNNLIHLLYALEYRRNK